MVNRVKRALVFQYIPIYNSLILYYLKMFNKWKGQNTQILQPYTGLAESGSLGKESGGSALLISTVCDACAPRSLKIPNREHHYECTLIKIIIAKNDVSRNKHLFKKIKPKTPLPKACTSVPENNSLAWPSTEILYHNKVFLVLSGVPF